MNKMFLSSFCIVYIGTMGTHSSWWHANARKWYATAGWWYAHARK